MDSLVRRISSRISNNKGGFFLAKYKQTLPIYCKFPNNPNENLDTRCLDLLYKSTDRMISNWKIASLISDFYSVKFFPILEPTSYFNQNIPNPHKSSISKYDLSEYGYKYFFKRLNNGDLTKNLIDLTNIFNEEEPRECKIYFLDSNHFSICGSKLIADYLAKRIIN